jgi:hypothetical protein
VRSCWLVLFINSPRSLRGANAKWQLDLSLSTIICAVCASAFRTCVAQQRALPWSNEIRWSQSVLRRLCGRQWNRLYHSFWAELFRSQVIVQKSKTSFGTCLNTLAERNGGPRSKHTNFRLPIANLKRICHQALRRRGDLARTDRRFRHRLRAAVWQQNENEAQPEYYSEKKTHNSPCFRAAELPHLRS